MNRRVVIVSRTRWSEPPRLRHQVAQLLAQRGHEVLFIERPGILSRGRVLERGPITRASSGELLHHQLRPLAVLGQMNAAVVRWSLASLAREWRDAAIVNFNYDGWMLRDLWPESRVVTIINDDFQFTAKRWMRGEAREAQRRTLERSDAALAVSYPLVRQCAEDTPNASLFLPWPRSPYQPPPAGRTRTDLLYWGFIENRIDWDLIEQLAERGVRMHFVGPIDRCPRALNVFRRWDIAYYGSRNLRDIPEVLEQCAATILPYDLKRSSLEITMSNRAFDLLGHGVPLLYAAFPDLLAMPPGVVRKCATLEDYLGGLADARANFDAVQPSIAGFLAEHTPDARYRQLATVLGL